MDYVIKKQNVTTREWSMFFFFNGEGGCTYTRLMLKYLNLGNVDY